MASRPGIRTLNNTGYNSVSRPTSPANYRGSGVRQISPTLAGTKRRTEVLATGRRGIIPQNVNTAATALRTVFTKGALSAMEATSEGAKALTENIRRLVPDNVPLVNLPMVTEPIAELPGVNVPIITNPVQFVDATIKTSQYSDDLVNEARIRAQKGDILSGIYVGTADTIVKGANDLYERVNKPGYTPTSKALAGVLKAGAGAVATVPAILQAGNYLVNPQRLVYNGDIPKTVSGVNVDGMPKISGVDSITISTDDVEVVNSVLGTAATSAGELAKEYIPKAVDAVKTEFRENPYGLTGQIIGGAILAKGVGSALPKKVTPKIKIEGEATTKSRVTGGGSAVRNRGGTNVVLRNSDNVKKAATVGGLGATAAYITENASPANVETIPQRVVTVTFNSNNSFIDDYIEDYPPKEQTNNKNRNPTVTDNPTAGNTLIVRPYEPGNTLRVQGGNLFKPEISRVVDYVKVSEIMGENNANKNNTRYGEENAEVNRTQNRVQNEFAYEYATVTAPRGSRGKRRIDIDIDLSRKPKKKAKRTKRTYAKRQIVNPIPWLWDEVPGFAADIPKKVELIDVSSLLTDISKKGR